MKTYQLCQMREVFLGQWRREYPFVPLPNLPILDQVCQTDSIDESRIAKYVESILGSLNAVHNKIRLLTEQVQRKKTLRDFLVNLLRELDQNEGERWLSQIALDVNKSSSKNSADLSCPAPSCSYDQGVFRSERSVGNLCCVPLESLPVCCHQSKPLLSFTVNCDDKSSQQSVVNESSVISVLSSNETVEKGSQCDFKINSRFFQCNAVKPEPGNSSISVEIQCDLFSKDCDNIVTQTQYEFENPELTDEVISFIKDKSTNLTNGDESCTLEDEESDFDNARNITIIDCSGDMFRPKKSGGSKSGGDGSDSVSGKRTSKSSSKDNFMALTSRRRVSREEPSQSMRLKDDSPSCSPLLTRNFQLLKLTSGFDLVLGDDDDKLAEKRHHRDDDTRSYRSIDTDFDGSKNSPSMTSRDPPQDECVTVSKKTDQLAAHVDCRDDVARCETDFVKDQPDLIKNVSLMQNSSSSKIKNSHYVEGVIVDTEMLEMDTMGNVSSLSPEQNSSKKGAPPPIPAKPRKRSYDKKESSASPVFKLKETGNIDGGYTDSDILEALSINGTPVSETVHDDHCVVQVKESENKVDNTSFQTCKIVNDDINAESSPRVHNEKDVDLIRRDSPNINSIEIHAQCHQSRMCSSPINVRERSPRALSPSSLSSSPSMASDFKSMISTVVVPVPKAVDMVEEGVSRNSTFYVNLDSPSDIHDSAHYLFASSPGCLQTPSLKKEAEQTRYDDDTANSKNASFLHDHNHSRILLLPRRETKAEVSSESENAQLVTGQSSVLTVQGKESDVNTECNEEQTKQRGNAEREPFEEKEHDDDSDKVSLRLQKEDKHNKQSSVSSDTSVDTLYAKEECLRSVSCISDADVREAISAFDQVVTSADQCEDSDNMHSRKRRSSTPNYVNWTINRALTASIHREESVSDDFASEEDTFVINYDDDSTSSGGGCISLPSPQFHRPTSHSHGSKDSGLCDDISVSDSLHSDLEMGRISDLRQIQEMERWEEEEEEAVKKAGVGEAETLDQLTVDNDYDSMSVTSDIVFLPHSPGKTNHMLRADIADDKPKNGQENKLDTSSVTSSLEDEIDIICVNTSYDEVDSGREGMLKMRQLLVKGVLDSEKSFLNILDLLLQYKNLLQASSQLSQAVISKEDTTAIFGNIETLHSIHHDFVSALEDKVANWTHSECIGEIFKILVFKFSEFVEYANNYHNAVDAIHRCAQENDHFHKIAEHITVNSTKEVTSLEDALFRPVQRVQRNTLVLHDLIKCTPEDHPDYTALQKALRLSQHNLENYQAVATPASISHENIRLVKSSFLVELVNGERKLRYVFLFNDILVCTKRETHRNKKVSFVIKWFAHLADTSFDTKFEYEESTKYSILQDVDVLKDKIRAVKKDLKTEKKKSDVKDKHRLVSLGGGTRAMEKLQKKLNQYEGQLILASPILPFKISLEGGKEYTLLMTTDYEREEWKEALQFLCKKCHRGDQHNQINSILVQELVNSVKETPQVNKIGNVLLQNDEEALMGTLNVNIHTMNGLSKECDTYCCLEMDSFGHFFMKAKTRVCEASRDPIWNEDFELELEGSQTLRILCFKKGLDDNGDILLGRGALELDRHWLKFSFQEKTVSMNEISLVISVKHTPAEKTMKRTPSLVINACFGVKISSSARREGKAVPTLVTACIQEVEKRGLDELGIYRVSGVTSDLNRIKKLFDRNVKAGAEALKDADIHAVTGILKMYLRELPEPLFTDALYQNFTNTLKLSDEEAKTQCVLTLYHSLPDTNYYTSVSILEHLVNVARNVGKNKMSINNLSMIFGPTLLAPAVKEADVDPLAMMFKGTEEAMLQASFINFLLGLVVSGKSLRKSAQ